MKHWIGLLALGVVVLAAGGAMVILQWHHTIGLGVVGLGVIAVLGGLVISIRDRKVASIDQRKAPVPRVQKGGVRNALIAVAVVVVIGVGTFYGTSYLAANQPSSNGSGPSSPTSSGTVYSSLASSTSSGQAASHTSSVATSPSFTCVVSPGTNYCSRIETSSSASQTSSTQASQTISSTSTTQSGQTISSTLATSTQSSRSGTSGYLIVLNGSASVVPNGQNETLTGAYLNNGPESIAVNIYIATHFENGTILSAGALYYPVVPKVSPGRELNFSDNMGHLAASGNYYVTFLAVGSSNQTLSLTTIVPFTVS